MRAVARAALTGAHDAAQPEVGAVADLAKQHNQYAELRDRLPAPYLRQYRSCM